MKKIPIIIDTDPGIDDTIAIITLAGSEKAEIKAITTTHGNIGLEGTTRNALALRDFLGLGCNVYRGAEKPMIVPRKDASFVHGENGLAGYELPPGDRKPGNEPAWDAIYRRARECPGELVIIALGPLTDIAIAILKYPDLKNLVKRLYMMGGSRNWGNRSRNAEFNIRADPHACRVVLSSGIPITMADLGFGEKCYFTGAELEKYYGCRGKFRDLFARFWERDRAWAEEMIKESGTGQDISSRHFPIHDANAARAFLLDGDCLVTEDYYVLCETQGSRTRGQTVFDYKNMLNRRPNVQLAVDIDRQKFLNLMTENAERAGKK